MKYKINKIRNKLKKKVVKSATFNDADPYVEDMFEDVAVEDTDRIIYLLDQGFDKLKAKERFEKEFPGKHAIWRGNETKAFLKWKADNNI